MKRSLALLALLAIFLLSALIGRYPAPGFLSFERLANDELAQRLLFNLRLPRLLTALLLGMTLSAAGMVFQLLFSNPLVEPGFLGVSQGAAFGAAFSIVFLGGSALVTQTSASFFALAGLGLSYLLAHRLRYGGWVLRLVLAGIAVSALFSSGLGLLKYLADPLTQLPEITFWLLGGLASLTWGKLISILPIVVVSLTVIYLYRWRLNLLALNEQTSFSLGVAAGRERWLLILAAVLPTAVLISVSGMVGWVGLIIPHIARRLFRTDARFSLPASMLLGGIFTMLCDDIARTLLAGEIPLGILTSLFGALIFLEYTLMGRAPHLPPLEMPSAADNEIALNALDQVGIAALAHRPVPQLSGGERQLLLLARALTQLAPSSHSSLSTSHLLLLDEPTAHLDLHNKFHIIEIMRRLRDSGVTLLMTNHEPDVVLAVADDVLLMESGIPPQFGTLDEVFTAEALSRVYQLPIRLVQVNGHKQVLWT